VVDAKTFEEPKSDENLITKMAPPTVKTRHWHDMHPALGHF